jgi:hypothetical protein
MFIIGGVIMYIIILMLLGWREIYITYDRTRQMGVQSLLNNNSIKTKSRTVYSGSRGGRGVVLASANSSTHYLYVKKGDYDKAKNLIG